jgi:hypothetical protein
MIDLAIPSKDEETSDVTAVAELARSVEDRYLLAFSERNFPH